MKLLIVTAIRECMDAIDRIFDKHGVRVYSTTNIRGIRNDIGKPSVADNWFGTDGKIPYDSVMLFSFTDEETAKATLQSLAAYNEKDNQDFPVRAFLLPVEDSI